MRGSPSLTLGGILLFTVLSVAPALAGPVSANDRAYAEAVAKFRSGHMSDAYGRFIVLAEAGDADAARIALFMYRFGPVLYGTHWDANSDELDYWTGLAKKSSGRPDPIFRPRGYVPMSAGPKGKPKAVKYVAP